MNPAICLVISIIVCVTVGFGIVAWFMKKLDDNLPKIIPIRWCRK